MMKNLIRMEEENYGYLGVATCYTIAVTFFRDAGFLFNELQVWDANKQEWNKLIKVLPNWEEEIFNWDIDTFNKFFDGYLLLTEEPLIGAN